EVPSVLSGMMEKLLATDPGERYQTTTQVEADLGAYLHGTPLPSRQHADEAIATESARREGEPHIESLSQVRGLLTKARATVSQLEREREELSARLQTVGEDELMAATRPRRDSFATRAAQWGFVSVLVVVGVYLIWNAWLESLVAP